MTDSRKFTAGKFAALMGNSDPRLASLKAEITANSDEVSENLSGMSWDGFNPRQVTQFVRKLGVIARAAVGKMLSYGPVFAS